MVISLEKWKTLIFRCYLEFTDLQGGDFFLSDINLRTHFRESAVHNFTTFLITDRCVLWDIEFVKDNFNGGAKAISVRTAVRRYLG